MARSGEWGNFIRSDSTRQLVPPNHGGRKFNSESGDGEHVGSGVAGIFPAVNLAKKQ